MAAQLTASIGLIVPSVRTSKFSRKNRDSHGVERTGNLLPADSRGPLSSAGGNFKLPERRLSEPPLLGYPPRPGDRRHLCHPFRGECRGEHSRPVGAVCLRHVVRLPRAASESGEQYDHQSEAVCLPTLCGKHSPQPGCQASLPEPYIFQQAV